jgi:hypothetical protein
MMKIHDEKARIEKEPDVFDLITVDDLTGDLAMLSDVIGLENVRKMIKEFNGLTFYIPKIKRLDAFVHRYLEENSNKTPKEIARFLSVSENFVKGLIRNK